MHIAGRTEERIFREDTGFTENMTAPVGGDKDHRFGFMIGAFNDGVRLVLKAKRMLHPTDESMIKFQRAIFNKYEIVFEHSRNIRYGNTLYKASVDYQQTVNFAKFVAYEKSVSMTLKDLDNYPDWDLKLSAEARRNVFDSAACIDYFKQHSLPSNKISLALAYSKISMSDIFNFNVELALTPRNGAKFLKVEHDRAHSWVHDWLPVKFGTYFK